MPGEKAYLSCKKALLGDTDMRGRTPEGVVKPLRPLLSACRLTLGPESGQGPPYSPETGRFPVWRR
jgi:hypothetical protein